MSIRKILTVSKAGNVLISFAFPLVLLLTAQYLCTPLLNSGDDAFMMYTLSGGFGESPTNLLHYNHIWHPALGWVIKRLFISSPGINWYTLFVLLFHYFGSVLIFYALIKRAALIKGSLLFLVFFFFFEIRLLLSLGFTGAAFIAACGASIHIIHVIDKKGYRWKSLLPAILLIIGAGMLRLQVAWLVMVLFLLLAFVQLKNKERVRALLVFAGIALLLFVLNMQHVSFYKKQIPGWERQESFRQSLFYSYNRPIMADAFPAFRDSAEMQLFFSGFLYDDHQFNSQRLKEIGMKITRQRWLDAKEDRQGIYWLFMELRVYLVLFGIFIAGLVIQKRKDIFRKWLASLFGVIVVYGGLFVFLKITPPLHIGLLTILWLHLSWNYDSDDKLPGKKWHRIAAGLLLVLSFCWMGIRVFEENRMNIEKRMRFFCALNELESHTDKLFIATDDSFPLSYFPVWDVPKNFPVTNLVYKDRLLAGTYRNTLQRFGISSIDSAIAGKDFVYFLGNPVPALEKKFNAKYSGPFPGFKCLRVRKLLKSW